MPERIRVVESCSRFQSQIHSPTNMSKRQTGKSKREQARKLSACVVVDVIVQGDTKETDGKDDDSKKPHFCAYLQKQQDARLKIVQHRDIEGFEGTINRSKRFVSSRQKTQKMR